MSSDDWFLSNELPKRVTNASLWTLIISGVWCLMMTSLSLWYQSPLHPHLGLITMIYPSFSTVYIVILAVISVGNSVTLSSLFSVTPTKPKNITGVLSSIMNPQIMLSMLTSGVLGMISTFCFCSLAWSDVRHDKFVMGAGLVTGMCHSAQFHLMSSNTLVFPIIHKERSSQIAEVFNIWTKSVFGSIRIIQYYLVTSVLISVCMYQSLPCHVSLSLGLATLTSATFLTLCHNTRLEIFSIIFTSPLPQLDQSQLLQYLSSSSPLLQTLSLQSLSRHVTTDTSIRSHIYSLSQPGGHPTNWNTVSKVCLDNINSMFPKPKSAPVPPVTASPVPTNIVNTPTIRRLGAANTTGAGLQDISTSGTKAAPPQPLLIKLFPTFDHFKSIGSSSDKSVNVMSMVSSVEVISQLICSSLKEDKFGVVQRDLADILTNLIKLDNELHNKKTQQQLAKSGVLRQSIKSGLYKISLQFGSHLNDISLPKNVELKMKSFAKLQEI